MARIRQARSLPIRRGFGRVRDQAGLPNAAHRAILILLGGVATDADRADGVAVGVFDQDAARNGDEAAVRGRGKGILEGWPLREAISNLAA